VFRPFNIGFAKFTGAFLWGRSRAQAAWPAALAFLGVIALALLLFMRVPTSFVPPEDQGYIISAIMLPTARRCSAPQRPARNCSSVWQKDTVIDHVFVAPGRDLIGRRQQAESGTSFILPQALGRAQENSPGAGAEVSRMALLSPTAS